MLARCAHPDLIGQFQHIGLIFFRVFLSHLLHPFCVLLYHLGCAVLVYHSKFSQYRGGLGYLYLDGKLLELLSIYLGEVLELDILMGKNISMSRTERTAIMEAKRIIDSQLAFAPSCEELSQQVHLSLTKLTRGFSSFYGMPIHQYIIEQRLIQAAQLLLDGDRNVGEVATIVGYGKPSNFAAAFKKKYGVAPKNYRASRFSNSK